jgi:hypothetical protein
MAATLITVRLLPTTPTDGQTFRSALQSLSITAWDRSVNNFSPNAPNTTPDTITGGLIDYQLGQASALADAGVALNITTSTAGVTSFDKTIIQHYAVDTNGQPLTDASGNVQYSAVATAIIVVTVPAGYQEYPTSTSFDVRFQLVRNAIAIPDQTVQYNIVTSPMPAAPTVQLTWFTHPLVSAGPPPSFSVDYTVPTSALLYLPPAPVGTLPANAGYINLGNAGQPPNFGDLVTAIDAVLALDSPSTATQLKLLTEPLSIAQCTEIAAEIIYNRVVSPPPEPGGFLETLYTTPENQASSGGPANQTWDNVRQTFEGKLQAYQSTNDSAASKLAGYVFAASAAAWAEYQTYHETETLTPQMARITVLLDPALNNPPIAPTPTVDVILTSSDPSKPLTGVLSPPFVVPAAYFYALGAKNPPQMTPQQRYKATVTTTADSLTQTLQAAIDSGFLSDGEVPLATSVSSSSITMAQAVRNLTALSAGFISGTDPQIEISTVSGTVGRWLSNTDPATTFMADFWGNEINTHSSDYLLLLLNIITGSNSAFIQYLQALPITVDTDLLKLTNGDWNTIFSTHSDWLPAFTLPGSPAQRTSAYVAYLRKLLTVGFTTTTGNTTTTSTSTLSLGPPVDALWKFISNYGSFSFGPSLDPTTFGTTLTAQFPNDPVAQQWVAEAITVINNLFVLTSGLSVPQGLRFSYMEALYSRGFTSPDAVKPLSLQQFQYALSGTVAYYRASDIWTAASGSGGSSTPEPGQGFQPVNGGSLTNCIPPDYLSPFGPIEYLSEVLQMTSGSTILGDVVSARRGPLGNLLVTESNLKLQVPCVDSVLESLEAIGSTGTATGAVNNIQSPVSENLLCAVPQYSTPSTTGTEPTVYTTLKTRFTSPDLPYSQPLDVSRSYLCFIGTTRFETMRCFRQVITELPQGASLQPAKFQSQLWRYPVAFDLALEYLHISEDENTSFFSGAFPSAQYPQLYGFQASATSSQAWLETACSVSGFLQATGLTYCELVQLANCGFIPISAFQNDQDMTLPECPPCCLTNLYIQFPGLTIDQYPVILYEIMYFVRLWRKVNSSCRDSISFAILADICSVLGLLNAGVVNPDFIRQLASLLMLVEYLHLPWGYKPSTTIGANRTKILGLWAGSTYPGSYNWALDQVLHGVKEYSQKSYKCRREAEFVKILKAHLDSLAALAGFTTTSPWNLEPTCTIRFIEVLVKIYASDFTVGEIIFLFTTQTHIDGDDPFPMPSSLETVDVPLDLPDDNAWGLWALRRKLLDVELREEEYESWPWRRIESTILEMQLAYSQTSSSTAQSLTQFAEHFFPEMLERLGHNVPSQNKQWSTPLPVKDTTTHLWSSEPCWPFHYDPNANTNDSDFSGQLWVQLPLKDRDVSHKLLACRQLNDFEVRAVQNLYFSPRAMLAPFSLIFSNFGEAVSHLVQESDEEKRFEFFQKQFALFHCRCKIIAEHLSKHVAHASCCQDEERGGDEVAWRILLSLIADENFAGSPWEDDSGKPPTTFEWDPHFSGGSFAGLLGLIGTGLFGKYESHSGINWAEMRGPLRAFGKEEDEWGTPVPTIIPSISADSVAQNDLALFKNGFLLEDAYGEAISGSEGFKVEWDGLMLIDKHGDYHFSVDHLEHQGRRSEHREDRHWLVTLTRGQKTWTLLNNHMPAEAAPPFKSNIVCLSRGAYHVNFKFEQELPPHKHDDDTDSEHSDGPHSHEGDGQHHLEETGFQLKYRGPDTHTHDKTVPFWCLIRDWKTGGLLPKPAEEEKISGPIVVTSGASAFLSLQYVSTIRDIRRTYQRAFKAVLFAHRFCLSARRIECDWQSELGFMLDHPHHFEGFSYYLPQGATTYQTHNAYFNFNFLPVSDTYGPSPNPIPDLRANPSPQRQTAMFDWWERIFDYTRLRKLVHDSCGKKTWLLFEEVATQEPILVQNSLSHLGVRLEDAEPLTTYFATPLYSLVWTDLLDERWAIRVWHANAWMKAVQKKVFSESYSSIQPALWVEDDPSVAIGSTSGNQDLVSFVQNALLKSKNIPPSWETLTDLNDGLRERARKSLIGYLCGMNQVPLSYIGPNAFATAPGDLSDLLLQDVTVGLYKRSSRIDDAIYAVQTFVQRARLGLETSWISTPEFLSLWNSRFCTFETWRAWKRREAYGEKWLAWSEIERLKETESFSFLLKELRQQVSTIVKTGRPLWWPSSEAMPCSFDPIQQKELATLSLRPNFDASPPVASYEGLSLLGEPLRDGRPTWLAMVPFTSSSDTPSSGNIGGTGSPSNATAAAVSKETSSAKPNSARNLQTSPISTGLDSLDVIPLWISTAIRLGARFIRVAAAGRIPALPFKAGKGESTPCCKECGKEHDDVVDEYYFWLQDSRYYSYLDAGGSTAAPSAFASLNPTNSSSGSGSGSTTTVDTSTYVQDATIGATSAVDPSTNWEIPADLPALLVWPDRPMVHLFWTRVHFKTLDPPRRSTEGLPIVPGFTTIPDLTFSGRNLDSLYFTVNNSAYGPPPTPMPAGFRYDLATDSAVIDPGTLPTFAQSSAIPPGLNCYPNFAYFKPGKPLFPMSSFGTAIALADMLRSDCSFECALQWYRSVYDPTARDNTWEQCSKSTGLESATVVKDHAQNAHQVTPAKAPADGSTASGSTEKSPEILTPHSHHDDGDHGKQPDLVRSSGRDVPCCPCGPVKGGIARSRAVLLQYLQTLIQWGDSLMARNSAESFQQASVICDNIKRILGPTPLNIEAHDNINPPMTVSNFIASPAPLNPELLKLYAEVTDRSALIHDSLNARRLHTGEKIRDDGLWGSHRRWDERFTEAACNSEMDCWSCCQPYRYSTMMSKAQEWAGLLKALGGSLLAAYEKGDGEYLSAMHATQDRQILDLGLDVSQQQWRAADWDLQALDQAMESALTKLRYYQGLIAAGLNAGENGFLIATSTSMESRAASQIVEAVAQDIVEEPDTYIGGAGVYGSPVNVELITGGTKQASSSSSGAKILNTIADATNTLAGVSSTEGGWSRRSEEWQFQVDLITIEIQQIKRQQLASWRRRHVALRELNNHQQQMEHSAEVQNFLRDRFTKQELYLFLQLETAAQYHQMYEIAMKVARQAQEAFWYERADTRKEFLSSIQWNNLHEGLLVGEQLDLALHSMEQAYMDLNCREYEITKSFSLRLHFPRAFLLLKTTGYCELELPEWMFDLDYPGQYLRRIRNITVSVPVVAGPYTGIHCRMQLLSSAIRYKPLLKDPKAPCCNKEKDCDCYKDDPYVITRYSGTEAIATSDGLDDDGLFELNFRDERYLPFEFSGAVSRWRIELPPANNEFDFDSLSDFIIKVNYTAREGGEELRRKASECAQKHLPGNGVRYFDIRHEFQDTWGVFQRPASDLSGGHRDFDIRLSRNMFPFLNGCRNLLAKRIHLFIEKDCSVEPESDHICVTFIPHRRGRGAAEVVNGGKRDFVARNSTECPEIYHGYFDVTTGPIMGYVPEPLGKLRLPTELNDVIAAYLLCEYVAERMNGDRSRAWKAIRREGWR